MQESKFLKDPLSGDQIVTLSVESAPQATGHNPVMNLFYDAFMNHQILLNSVNQTATVALTQGQVQSVLAGSNLGRQVQGSYDKLQRAIVIAMLLVLYHYPELIEHPEDFNLEVITLFTALYSQFQHTNSGTIGRPLFTHGFNGEYRQNYHETFDNMSSQIVHPFSLIPESTQTHQEVVNALFDAVGYESNGYHFFSHPHFGIGALIHIDRQWTLVFNTGQFVSADQGQLVNILANAHTGIAEMMGQWIVNAAIMGVFVLTGSAVGALIARLLCGDWSGALAGAGIGGLAGGAGFVVGARTEKRMMMERATE